MEVRFKFTDKDVRALDCKQWHRERDWEGNRMPIPQGLADCQDESILRAWNMWLFLSGALKAKLRKACPDRKIPTNLPNKIFFSLTGDGQKVFILTIHGAWVRNCLGLPREITVQADCPFEAHIKFIEHIL